MKLLFGGNEYEKVEVDVSGYERKAIGEYYDDNWLCGTVSILVGGFSGQFDAAFFNRRLFTILDPVGKSSRFLKWKS